MGGPSRTVKMFGNNITGLPAGTCGVYSSMSYVLIGLLLIGHADLPWDQYEQNVWKEHFPLINFSIHGTCGQYTDADGSCTACKPADVSNMSCTNGFTCGNLVAPPMEVARFVWALFMRKLLKPGTMKEMLDYKMLGTSGSTDGQTCGGFCSGCLYGLGVQAPADTVNTGTDPPTFFPGHAGETYGKQRRGGRCNLGRTSRCNCASSL